MWQLTFCGEKNCEKEKKFEEKISNCDKTKKSNFDKTKKNLTDKTHKLKLGQTQKPKFRQDSDCDKTQKFKLWKL